MTTKRHSYIAALNKMIAELDSELFENPLWQSLSQQIEPVAATNASHEVAGDRLRREQALSDNPIYQARLRLLDAVQILQNSTSENRNVADRPHSQSPSVGGDDLTKIRGITPALQIALYDRGVTRFAQIANWSPEERAKISLELELGRTILQQSWIEQADLLSLSRKALRTEGAPAQKVATTPAANSKNVEQEPPTDSPSRAQGLNAGPAVTADNIIQFAAKRVFDRSVANVTPLTVDNVSPAPGSPQDQDGQRQISAEANSPTVQPPLQTQLAFEDTQNTTCSRDKVPTEPSRNQVEVGADAAPELNAADSTMAEVVPKPQPTQDGPEQTAYTPTRSDPELIDATDEAGTHLPTSPIAARARRFKFRRKKSITKTDEQVSANAPIEVKDGHETTPVQSNGRPPPQGPPSDIPKETENSQPDGEVRSANPPPIPNPIQRVLRTKGRWPASRAAEANPPRNASNFGDGQRWRERQPLLTGPKPDDDPKFNMRAEEASVEIIRGNSPSAHNRDQTDAQQSENPARADAAANAAARILRTFKRD